MKHTKEPWSAHAFANMWDGHYKTEIRNEAWETAAVIEAKDNSETATANAQRIVECVNAMAGVADPASAIAAAREALEELLAEADAYAQLMPRHEPGSPSAKAERAIALLKGVQP